MEKEKTSLSLAEMMEIVEERKRKEKVFLHRLLREIRIQQLLYDNHSPAEEEEEEGEPRQG